MTDHAMHSPSPKAMTGGLAAVAYGGVTYLLFLGTFLYAMARAGSAGAAAFRMQQAKWPRSTVTACGMT